MTCRRGNGQSAGVWTLPNGSRVSVCSTEGGRERHEPCFSGYVETVKQDGREQPNNNNNICLFRLALVVQLHLMCPVRLQAPQIAHVCVETPLAGNIFRAVAPQMPFAHQMRPVSGLLKILREHLLLKADIAAGVKTRPPDAPVLKNVD